MNIFWAVYGIMGSLAGLVTLIGLNSLMSRDPQLLSPSDKTTVDLLQGKKGKPLIVFVLFLTVSLWWVFVLLFFFKKEEPNAG